MQDTAHSIFHSAKRFFSGTMLSRVSGLGRDIAMAFAFGTESTLAALLVAFRFAHLLRRLLGEGAFQMAFIPTFENLRHENSQHAGRFFLDIYAGLSLLLAGIVIFGMSICGLWLWQGSLSSGNAEILWLTFLMMPSLLFICLFGLNASLLQCEKHYFLPAVAPTAFNLVWILGALSLRGLPIAEAMSWMAIYINAACFSQWLFTIPATWKLVKSYGLPRLWGNLKPFGENVRQLCRPLMLGMVGVGAAQINNALDAVFARYADAAGPAYLWYAIRIQQLPLGLIGIAFAGALLPALSRAIKSGGIEQYRQLLKSTLRYCLWLMIPITIGMFVFGKLGIKIIYEHGDFSADSVQQTTHCLWGYAVGLIPMALVLILAPGYYARGDYRTPMQASVASMILNILLNSLFIFSFGWGTLSVALATSFSAWFNYAWLAWFGAERQCQLKKKPNS